MNNNKTLSKKLSPRKRKFIEYLKYKEYNNNELSKIRKKIGISSSTYYRWLGDKELTKIAREESNLEFKESVHAVLQTLKKEALKGNVKAIKLFLEKFDNIKDKTVEDLSPDEMVRLAHIIIKEEKEQNNP